MRTHSYSDLAPVRETHQPRGLCVLIVEDDEADAYLIGRALEDNPAVETVVRARDGVEALGMIALGEVAPDMAFIDLHMPRMDGFGLLTALASRPTPSFPTAVLTSSAAPNDAIRSRLRSATRVVTKPDNVTELYAALATALDALCPARTRPTISKPATPLS
ncbi:MAG: response regulator receiver protein [Phenylobacterium sp.]|jgi:CheY-like chemotaxis protein|uniref:response regulator n=1 Tax=Phenylobacterium sp. TaxID=1871053 RepID=UPI00261C3ABB|nr:response regulator [Phenylobacterium sp.]MDB5426618.1 response regulator receiver protein [Phenylobacterium sp.]MDB5436977.1 response regulator receiver protein [Phenylobacterium sp.]MDB5497930.1 response regulator receiver protein [Phenylobacterium sp.]